MSVTEIAVVGAGPAGLAAAIQAARAGARVTLLDENSRPGGQLFKQIHKFFGSKEHGAGIRGVQIGEDLLAEAGEAGVEIRLDTVVYGLFDGLRLGLVCGDHSEDLQASSVILATGPLYKNGRALGFEEENVVNVLDVLRGETKVGDNVVVWGNRKPGIGVALSLVRQGKKVTIVGKEKSAGFDINPSFKWRYMIYLRQNGVKAYNDCDIEEVKSGEIVVKTYDGYRFPVKCDTIVVTEREPNQDLKNAVQGEGIELFVIGDALVPRNLSSAVHDGFHIGTRI